MRGKLIVIEGTDGSGKETQSKKLVERLAKEGFLTETMSFPMYHTPSGRIVGQSYLGKDPVYMGWEGDSGWFGEADKVPGKVASLYYAADRLFHKPTIEKFLDQGKIVILDRYAESNFGHQAGKIKDSKERDGMVDWLYNLEYNELQISKPDSVIFLHMPLEVSLELRKQRGDKIKEKADGHESNIEHLRHAEQTYLEVAKKFNWDVISCSPERTMNSLRTIEDINNEVYFRVISLIKR